MGGCGNMILMILFCAFLVVYSHAFNLRKFGDKEFGKCPPEKTRFQVFLKTSITDCIKQCAKRPVCKVIGYKRSYNMCELHTAAALQTEAINDKKCVQIKMDTVDTSQITGGCSCKEWQVCDVTTSTCSYKECDPHMSVRSFTNTSSVIYGNLNYEGSRKRLRCKSGFHIKSNEDTTVCSATGQWSSTLECEPVISNVAEGKPAEQSSHHSSVRDGHVHGNASAAVDGNTVQIYYNGTCFHTLNESNPWWRVNLESIYNISSFVLYNRMDPGMNLRTHDIEVKFGLTLENLYLIDFIPGVLDDIYRKELENEMVTQYAQVSIRSNGTTTNILHLCEVQLYGYPV